MIPKDSKIYQTLEELVLSSSVLVISGLPGVGKSLYVNQALVIAKKKYKATSVIQWDVARKAFETDELSQLFPMGDGVVHNGVKLSAGLWLINVVSDWIKNHNPESDFLLIEAPLVGHRFIELMQIQKDDDIESFMASDSMKVVVPIPSIEVRIKIEADRKAQVEEEASSWMGAKPSVMLLIWKELCELANDLGKDIDVDSQPPYDPKIYEFVFQRVLKNRHFIPLFINEIYELTIRDENELHDTDSLVASPETAKSIALKIVSQFLDLNQIDTVVEHWYKT